MLRKLPVFVAVISLNIAATLSAHAQATRISAEDYGKTVLPLRESLGNSVAYIKKQGNIFEPISQLPENDPIRISAKAIGRLDILFEQDGKRNAATCTAAVVRSNLILTNHHCVPGLSGKIIETTFVINYERTDGQGAIRVLVDKRPVEVNKKLDYALLRLAGELPQGIKPIKLVAKQINPKDRLLLIHHPAGRVKVMTRFRCRAAASTFAKGPYLRHLCETLPGSSGALVFLGDGTSAVGLHHTGGLDANNPDSYNKGTLMATLLEHSNKLRQGTAATQYVADQVSDHTPTKSSDGITSRDARSGLARRSKTETINKILGNE